MHFENKFAIFCDFFHVINRKRKISLVFKETENTANKPTINSFRTLRGFIHILSL